MEDIVDVGPKDQNIDLARSDVNPKKKKNITMIIIIIGVGLAAFFLFKGSGWKQAPVAAINEFDEGTIDSVLNEESNLEYALPKDNSPAFFSVPQGSYSDEQVIDLAAKIGDRHKASIDAMAKQLASDSALVMDVTAMTLLGSTKGGVITEAGIDLWFKALEKWTPMFTGVSASVAGGIAQVAAAEMDSINNATECVETTFVKKVTSDTTTTETSSYKVEVTNNSSKGFLGMNKRSSSSEVRTAIKEIMRHDTSVVEYIPHCTNWQLDPTQMAAIMVAGELALVSLYGMLTAVLKMAPRAEQFVKVAPIPAT